jgi:DNA polymerase I
MRILFDIETDNYLEHMTKIHCIAAINVDTDEIWRFRPDEVKKGLKFLQASKVLIAHNGIDFDMRAIKKIYPKWTYTGEVYDTLIAAKLAFPDIKNRDFKKLRSVMNKPVHQRTDIEKKRMACIGKHSLEAYGLRMGCHKGDFGKEVGFETFSEDMMEYCVQDVIVNAKLFHRLEQEDISQEALKTEHESQRICLAQTEKGFNFNIDKAHELEKQLLERKDELTKLICKDLGGDFLVNMGVKVPKRTTQYKELLRGKYTLGAAYTKLKIKPFNPNSRYDVGQRLISRFGWKPKDYGTDGKPTLSEEVLDKMKFPVAKHISEYLMIDKRLGMLSNGNSAWIKLYNEETKSIHGRVNTLGAGTSRCTHSRPNLAQIPAVRAPWGKECRELFEPPKGMKLYDVDLSGIELRMLAHYMTPWDNGKYGDIIINADIHQANADAAGIDSRDTMKTLMYARLYGSGMQNLADVSGLPVKVIKEKMANLDKNIPALKSLTDAVKHTIKTKGYVTALDKRRIYCSSEHASLNYLLQSAGAIVAKMWMNFSVEEMSKLGYELGKDYYQVAFIHDQYDWVYDPKQITHEVLYKASQDALDRVQEDLKIRMKLDCAACSGDNFSEVH